ncbi:unnamed protein product [Ixodes persulcatus]
MKCVVRTITLPSLRFWRSMPLLGSSRNTIWSPISAIPTESFRFCPPLSLTACTSALSVRSILQKGHPTSSSMQLLGMPFILAKNVRCCLAVSGSKRMSSWRQTPSMERIWATSSASSVRRP